MSLTDLGTPMCAALVTPKNGAETVLKDHRPFSKESEIEDTKQPSTPTMTPIKDALTEMNNGMGFLIKEEKGRFLQSFNEIVLGAEGVDIKKIGKDDKKPNKERDQRQVMTLERRSLYFGCVIA